MDLVEGGDRLRRLRGIALDKCKCGRPLEYIVQAGHTGLLGGDLGEAVLDYLEGGIGFAQTPTQLGSLGYGNAPVVDREDCLGGFELLAYLFDYCCFFITIHMFA